MRGCILMHHLRTLRWSSQMFRYWIYSAISLHCCMVFGVGKNFLRCPRRLGTNTQLLRTLLLPGWRSITDLGLFFGSDNTSTQLSTAVGHWNGSQPNWSIMAHYRQWEGSPSLHPTGSGSGIHIQRPSSWVFSIQNQFHLCLLLSWWSIPHFVPAMWTGTLAEVTLNQGSGLQVSPHSWKGCMESFFGKVLELRSNIHLWP
jgi:hypothetical protein